MLTENRKQILLWGYDYLKHWSIPIMRRYASSTLLPWPVVPVGGYPKSGTTWVSRMVANYMDLPLVNASEIAFGFKYVVHNHWSYNKSLEYSIQVVRDGRDVMVSIYMNMMAGYTQIEKSLSKLDTRTPGRILRENIGLHAEVKKQFKRILGKDFDPWDVHTNLSAFIEYELQRPFLPAVREPWPRYVSSWLQSKNTVVVKYEDLLGNGGVRVLGQTLAEYSGKPVEGNAVENTYQRYHFKEMSGRNPGTEDRNSFARKGIAGDWKNYFSQEAREVFEHYAGGLLIDLGYEKDSSWVKQSG